MTPNEVLASSTPQEAATRLAEWLREHCSESGSDPKNVFLWSPDEAKERGWGSGWTVCWEEGPFEWAMISAGCTLYAGEFGTYSQPGPFPNGLSGKKWFAEQYNSFILNFYET